MPNDQDLRLFPGLDQSDSLVQEDRPIGSIRRIEVRGAIDVFITRSANPRMVVAGDTAESVNSVRTTVHGDKLVIDGAGGSSVVIDNGRVSIIATGGSIAAGGDVCINGNRVVVTGGVVIGAGGRAAVALALPLVPDVRIQGAGDVTIRDARQEALSIDVMGSGDVTADGSVVTLTARVMGSGDVNAEDLAAQHVTLDVAGSGDIVAFARVSARACVAGSGDIRVYGNPPDRDESVAGSGRVKFCR